MISNIHEVEKVIGNLLASEAGISNNRVLNALSVSGVDMSKFIEDNVLGSYDLDDVVIVFELKTRDSSANFSEEISKTTIRQGIGLEMSVICYGNESMAVAANLRSRLLSNEISEVLNEKEIFINSISNQTSLNEFDNMRMWIRTDFTISIDVELEVKKLIVDEDFEKLNTLSVESSIKVI